MNQGLILLVIIGALLLLVIYSSKPNLFQKFSAIPTEVNPTVTPAPTTAPQNKGETLSQEFIYPNSVETNEGNQIILKSLNDPQQITNWYKNKIKDSGLTATSFIQTNTNGEVLNKLVGASSGREIRVEISKTADRQEVTIKVQENG